jgi:DNA-binding transcriptional LysR family regulator
MDHFSCIQAFVRVAETRSFSTAARQLGVTPPVITSRIKRLEQFVHAPLFHRTTRKVSLSQTALAFFEECAELLARVDSVTDRMRLTHDTPAGPLRLQVLHAIALGPFASVLQDFSLRYPKIRLDITVNDQPMNPIGEGYDVSLQLFRPSGQGLIARKLIDVHRLLCASPQYLRRRGLPLTPSDLSQHDIGVYSVSPTRDRWTFRYKGEVIAIQPDARMRSNSVHLLRDFARIGAGITCLPKLVCSDDLLSGALVPLLPEHDMPPLELLAVYPATHRETVKVKLFIEFLRERFSGEPEWDSAMQKYVGLVSLNQKSEKHAKFKHEAAEALSA